MASSFTRYEEGEEFFGHIKEALGPERYAEFEAVVNERGKDPDKPPYDLTDYLAPFLEKDHPELWTEFKDYILPTQGSSRHQEFERFMEKYNNLETDEEKKKYMSDFMGFDKIKKPHNATAELTGN